ncbi:hypothetical protein B0J12DRAFT_582404, partial [Macrophomina phaseolina]
VRGYLRGRHHGLSGSRVEEVAEKVGGWHGLIRHAGELEVPVEVDRAITELPLYEDGLRCEL